MLSTTLEIDPSLSVSDLVARDYRTAEVFRRYGISYCCGGKWPIDLVCEMQGVDRGVLMKELQRASSTIPVSNQLDFENWETGFLINYIINVHHRYLEKTLPLVSSLVGDFTVEHGKKFEWLVDLEQTLKLLSAHLLTSIRKEEDVLFKYIQHLAHAYKGKEAYAILLVRTLRKPIGAEVSNDHSKIEELLHSIRTITNLYIAPPNVCTSHKVVMAKLKEMDDDIMQHSHLEQTILYPRALAMETEVLAM